MRNTRRNAAPQRMPDSRQADDCPKLNFTLISSHEVEHEYDVTMHPAGAAVRLLRKLMKLVGGTAAQGFGGIGNLDIEKAVKGDVDIDGEQIAVALDRFLDLFADYGDEKLFKEVLKHTTRDGINCFTYFDRMYQGNLAELFEAVFLVLKGNFGPLVQGFVLRARNLIQLYGQNSSGSNSELAEEMLTG